MGESDRVMRMVVLISHGSVRTRRVNFSSRTPRSAPFVAKIVWRPVAASPRRLQHIHVPSKMRIMAMKERAVSMRISMDDAASSDEQRGNLARGRQVVGFCHANPRRICGHKTGAPKSPAN